jgi:ABC-type branched-subunit amino acid transport system substrate-binding protein
MAFGLQSSSSFSLPEGMTAIEGLAKAVNDAGGIGGRKIDVITCNDGNDPNLAAACAREAVQDKVAAVIGYYSANGAVFDPILQAAKIPYIGASSISDYTTPIVFPVDGGALTGQVAVTYALGKLGCRKLSTVVNAIPQALISTSTASNGFKQLGGSSTTIQVPVAASDYAPSVAETQSAAAQCLVSSLAPAATVSLLNAVASSNIKGIKQGILGFSLNPQILTEESSQLSDTIVSSPWAPTGSWRQDLTREMAAIDPKQPVSDFAIRAWTAMTLFVDAAKTVNVVNNQTILSALQARGYSVPSIAPYNATKPGPDPKLPRLFTTSSYIYQVKNGQLVADPTIPGALDVASVIAGA